MSEEKFTNLLRESMELERQVPLQEEGWQALQGRLEADTPSKNGWNKWYLLLLLLGFGALYILQWQQLKNTKSDLKELQQQLELNVKTDTVFKQILVPQYDTIYKTIIKEIPLKQEKQSPKDFNKNKQNDDLSFLKPLKTKELNPKNTGNILLDFPKITVINQTDKSDQELESSLVYLETKHRKVYPLELATPIWNDFFLQIGLALHGEAAQQKNKPFQMPHLDKLDGFKMDNLSDMSHLQSPFIVEGLHEMNPFFSAATFSVAQPSGLPDIGETVLTDWRSRRHQMLTQIDIVFPLRNKRFQPILNFSAASNWQRQTMILNSSYQAWSDFSWIDATGLTQFDDISSISFRSNAQSPMEANATSVSNPVHIQASFYSAFELWYEFNIGLQYKF